LPKSISLTSIDSSYIISIYVSQRVERSLLSANSILCFSIVLPIELCFYLQNF